MRLRIDVLVLIAAVIAMLALAPGHGVWGYVIGFLTLALVGGAAGLIGRKYPQVYGQPRQRSR